MRLASSKPLATELQDFIDVSRAAGRKIMLMTFSSMPVPRRSIFRVAIRMLRETKHKMSLIFVGKGLGMAGQDLVSASAELIAAGQLMEVENADFGSLFPQLDAFIVHGGLGTTVAGPRTSRCRPLFLSSKRTYIRSVSTILRTLSSGSSNGPTK